MHKIILCMCVFCARVWGMLRADEPESRKPNSGASSSKRRTSRADRLSSGRRGCLDVEPIGDGAKMFQSAVRLETFRKELFPHPPSPRTGGEADEGQPKRHPAREGDFSRRGRKSRERRHPSPFTTNGRRGGRRAAEAAPRARRRLLPAGQEKPRETAPVPLHHERAARRTKDSRSGGEREPNTRGRITCA